MRSPHWLERGTKHSLMKTSGKESPKNTIYSSGRLGLLHIFCSRGHVNILVFWLRISLEGSVPCLSKC